MCGFFTDYLITFTKIVIEPPIQTKENSKESNNQTIQMNLVPSNEYLNS